MKVDVLFFRGCPHHQLTVDLVREVIQDLDVAADFQELEVLGADDAIRLRFLGSPTVQVDGKDIEPGADQVSDYALACRRYGSSGVPTREMIETALRQGRDHESSR